MANTAQMTTPLPRIRRTTLLLALAFPMSAALAQGSASQQLGEVVVSASGFEQEIKNAPASITVITREELEQKRVNSIAEALSGVEGVDVGSGTAGGNKTGGLTISMRGLPSDYTLILIDGRRQNAAGNVTPNAFNDSATAFMPPASAIERIEIIRGPMSTLYGSDAMGGVVNIITRKVGKEWTGTVTVDGTFQSDSDFGDSRAASVYLSGPLVQDVLGLQIRGRVFDRDESEIEWPGQSTTEGRLLTMGQNPVKAHIETWGARLSLTPNKDHDITLDVDQTRQWYDNDRGQMGTLDGTAVSGQIHHGYGPRLKFNRDQYTLAHTWRFGAGMLESSIMEGTTETIGRTIPAGTPGKVAGSARKLEAQNTVFDTKLVTSLGDHMLSIGGQWWDAEMTDGLATSKYSHEQWGLFAEDEWRFAERLALTLGVRHDNHSEFGGHTSPRAYLVWNANDQWTVKGGVAAGYKTPSLDQMFSGIVGYGAQGTRPFFGNPDLKPETSVSSELSARYDSLSGLTANATLFHTDFEDKITTQNYAGPGIPANSLRYENVSEAVIQGLELGADLKFARDWTISGNYTYTDSEQKSGTSKGDPLQNTPEHMVNLTLKWQATQKLSAWIRGEYRSERFRDNDSATSRAKATLGDFEAYDVFHLGGAYQVSKNLSINATIYNLFNRDFVDYQPYVSNTGTGAISYGNTYNNNQEPRRLWVSASMSF
ncbi:MAG: TonB-dependent receptor [Azoarcus sp.]|nr:TonB-dependent receptor [Azoarcus sp.]